MSSTVAWFDCFSGIAGDMALGALVDAGADPQALTVALESLSLPGWGLSFEPVLRAGIGATLARVEVADTTTQRHYTQIVEMIRDSDLSQRSQEMALAVFTRLGQAEARIHRVTLEEVHFHEVGAVDSVIDVVGVCVALDLLEVDRVSSSAVANGTGTIRAAHGVLPNPPPAVVELLRDIPVTGSSRELELTTPTGAAILAALGSDFGPLPPMLLKRVGRGAGSRDNPGVPNVVQVLIGETQSAVGSGEGQPLTLIETNLDDVTGELLADAAAAVLGAGALDCWITPVLGKKGRPAQILSALADPSALAAVSTAIKVHTGTLGLRTSSVRRWAETREFRTVLVRGHQVRVKVGPHRAKVEHDDAARVAARLGLTVEQVIRMALAEHTSARPDQPMP